MDACSRRSERDSAAENSASISRRQCRQVVSGGMSGGRADREVIDACCGTEL